MASSGWIFSFDGISWKASNGRIFMDPQVNQQFDMENPFNGNSRILKWRYCTIQYKAIFCGDIPLHRPYIGLIYGRYLQFRILEWPLIHGFPYGNDRTQSGWILQKSTWHLWLEKIHHICSGDRDKTDIY